MLDANDELHRDRQDPVADDLNVTPEDELAAWDATIESALGREVASIDQTTAEGLVQILLAGGRAAYAKHRIAVQLGLAAPISEEEMEARAARYASLIAALRLVRPREAGWPAEELAHAVIGMASGYVESRVPAHAAAVERAARMDAARELRSRAREYRDPQASRVARRVEARPLGRSITASATPASPRTTSRPRERRTCRASRTSRGDPDREPDPDAGARRLARAAP
jgi:hypothetical protein